MNICIDIDGTLTASDHYLPYFNDFFGCNVKNEDQVIYDFEELFNVSEFELRKFYDLEGHRMQIEASLLEHAKTTLYNLRDKHNLSIITARRKENSETSKEWLKLNEIDWIPLYAIGHPNKLEIAKELECDIFIEDHPTFSLEAAEAGIKVILMDAVYNQNLQHENIYRVFSWDEVENIINSFE